ncbi:MAG: glycoside hydrolase family 31 protein [Anaerolineae bacterium]
MRMTHPVQVTPLDVHGHPLVFGGQRGERLQLTVLDHDLVRVQHFPDGVPRLDRTWMVVGADGDVPRDGRRRDDLSPFALPPFAREIEDDTIRLRTAYLTVDISLAPFALRWFDEQGRMFAADLPGRAYAYDRATRTIYHYLQRRSAERYYGFGERAGPLDKAGMRMRMLNLDAMGYDAQRSDPLYKHFPFYITLVSDLGIAYGLFYDNLATTVFDMGCELDNYHGPYRLYCADDGDLDYYLIYGPTIAQVVRRFADLTGHMVLPPRWSLGYLGSTMYYTEAPDAQAQLGRFVALCQQYDIPCDGFHLSSGYTTGRDGKRYVFCWDRDKVPDPPALARTFRQAGMHLIANVKPCLLTTHPTYGQMAAQGGFVRQAESDAPELSVFWGGEGAYLDFTNPQTYAWWQAQVRQSLLDMGIDATWNDNNEFEIWDDEARCAGFGSPLRLGLIRPLQTLLMVRASYEAQRLHRPHERPFVLSRSGCPGIQRYAQTWSGDNFTSWQTLRYNLPMGLGLSLSGAPNTGHDVGGFAGPRPDPELFVRWVQVGIFFPRFCIHSWNEDGTVNEPWMYPEILPLVRDALRLRYRLIPYLYTLFFEAARTGDPIMRPLVYAFAHDERCQTESFDFMLGPNLLVAPVLEPGQRQRDVYLPPGLAWYDFYRGACHEGGQSVTLDAPLTYLPLLVPEGGMIPLGKPMRHVGEQPDDERDIIVFPHRASGQGRFTLIEDDGLSMDYQRGVFTEVELVVEATPAQIVLACTPSGAYPLPYRQVTFVLPPGEERAVRAGAGSAETVGPDGRRRVMVPLAD